LDRNTENHLLPDWRTYLGFAQHRDTIRKLVQDESIPQVILFEGREGLGKSAMAAMTAAMLLCASKTACGDCTACQWVLAGEHPEVLWVESQTGKILIDDAVQVQEFLALNPELGSSRVAVILDADQMMSSAANRLLKTLEEPQNFAKIIMTTSRPKHILDTILSRCIQWQLSPPPREQVEDLVREEFQRSHKEELGATALDTILKRSGMAPGAAIRLCTKNTHIEELEKLFDRDISPSQMIDQAEALSRSKQISLSELLIEWEILLNKKYIRTLKNGNKEAPVQIQRRRKILRDARKLVERGKIALNSQLVTESLASTKWTRVGV